MTAKDKALLIFASASMIASGMTSNPGVTTMCDPKLVDAAVWLAEQIYSKTVEKIKQ